MDRQIVEGMESQEEGVPGNLRKQLALAVRSIRWSYAIFWSLSATQHGVLEWRDGYYNGDIKTRKTVQAGELKPDKIGLQRSEQLRELYESLLEGEHDPQTNQPSVALSPEDLTDEEWYYFVCMSFVFNAGEGLPGRTLANNQTIWLCNAQCADSKVFSRTLLAKSASIQTVVCFAYLGGVIEIGVTDLVPEDHGLLQHIKLSLLDFSKPMCSEKSSQNDGDGREDPMCVKTDVKVVDSLVLDSYYSPSEEKELDMDSPNDCSNGCEHNHQTEDSFMVDHPNGEGESQVQSWHFTEDDFSNGLQGSIHSSDCISEAVADHNKPGFSPKRDNAKHLHLKQLKECDHSKLSCLDLKGDDFSHYKRTVFSILKNSDQAPDSLCMHCCSRKSSFVNWHVLEVRGPPVQQEMLKKALLKVPLLHSASVVKLQGENQSTKKMVGLNWGQGHDLPMKKVEQDKFMVLRSLIPSIEKMDKASILDDTILYLKELEERVKELESCMASTELEGRNRRKFPDIVEKTSDKSPNGKKRRMNKRKAYDIDETDPELGKTIASDGLGSEVKVNAKDREVVIEMKCPYREYVLVDILEAINDLQLDACSVQSSTVDGILSLTLKSKFRGVAVSSVGMIIKQALWKVNCFSKDIFSFPGRLMTGGVLEVLLVKADGIQRKNLIGSPAYRVVAECGCQVRRSKVTKGKGDKAWWNEKFSFELPLCEWKHSTHLKLKLMNSGFFGEGTCVGEITIYVGGIVADGIERDLREVRPSPYNVVLDDDTYRGEVVVGLRFIVTDNVKADGEGGDRVPRDDAKGSQKRPRSIWRSKIRTCRIWWRKLLPLNYSKSEGS